MFDRKGITYGRLTVLEYAGAKGGEHQWKCRCACGTELVASGRALGKGDKKSCGCARKGVNRTHGHTTSRKRTPTYSSWLAMVQRCNNPHNIGYHKYGGAGIKVCERWLQFENFLADMGERPSKKHTIDRHPNPGGNYEPGNCRWATYSEQKLNQRTRKMITYNGKTQGLYEWAKELRMSNRVLADRLRRGWTVERAFTLAVRPTPGATND